MKERIKKHVQDIFAAYKGVKMADELEEELIQSLGEKFIDYQKQGYTDEESYQSTIDSIGEVSELVELIDPNYNEQREKIYGSFSNGIMAASVYAMLFVALMIAFDGTITRDSLILPAAFLLVGISVVQWIVKGNSRFPRWLVLGSFVMSVLVAVGMTVVFVFI